MKTTGKDGPTINENKLAIISDGSKVLSLGNIGPEEARKYLDEKAQSYNKVDTINAIALPITAANTANFAKIVKSISPGFDCLSLEYIEEETLSELKSVFQEVLDIPLYNFTFNGMPILILASLYNGIRLLNKNIEEIKIVINGTNKLTLELVNLFISAGFKNIMVLNNEGIISPTNEKLDQKFMVLAGAINPQLLTGDLKEALEGADIYLDMVNDRPFKESYFAIMDENPIIVNLGEDENVDLETLENYEKASIYISPLDRPFNSINIDIMAASILKGLVNSSVKEITTEMMLEVSKLISNELDSQQISSYQLLTSEFNKGIYEKISQTVVNCSNKLCMK